MKRFLLPSFGYFLKTWTEHIIGDESIKGVVGCIGISYFGHWEFQFPFTPFLWILSVLLSPDECLCLCLASAPLVIGLKDDSALELYSSGFLVQICRVLPLAACWVWPGNGKTFLKVSVTHPVSWMGCLLE